MMRTGRLSIHNILNLLYNLKSVYNLLSSPHFKPLKHIKLEWHNLLASPHIGQVDHIKRRALRHCGEDVHVVTRPLPR